jgi:hypothetical protein
VAIAHAVAIGKEITQGVLFYPLPKS